MRNKIVALILTMLTLITMLTGCGNKVECDLCGEEKKCTTKTIFGEEISLCKDCIDEFSGY